MKYFPVIIPTLNRYTHLRNCVESLARCTHAEETELVIGLDYPPHEKYKEGYQQIKSYIPTITGFKKVTFFEHKENLGPNGNWAFLANYCKTNYGAYIATEDDNIFAPAFLDYINQALELFWDDERVVTVSGYNCEDAYDQGEYASYLSKDNCSWGAGYWAHKENKYIKTLNDISYFKNVVYSRKKGRQIIDIYPALYSMLYYMVQQKAHWGDVMLTTMNILEGTYQLRPALSLVRNCGYDGSGINCETDDNGLSSQKISEAALFDFSGGIGSSDTDANREALYNHALPKDVIKRNVKIQEIYNLYRCNTNPYYAFKDAFIKLRSKVAIRTRLRKVFCAL